MVKLSELINNKEVWVIEDKEGNEHTFKFFVPISIIQLREELAEIDSEYENMLRTIECLLVSQHDYMDRSWIEENISYSDANMIYLALIKKMNESIEAMNRMSEGDKKKGRWPFKS